MEFQLSERTVAALLMLPDWMEQIMTKFETLQNELTETKASMDSVKDAVTSYVAKNDAAIADLKNQLANLDNVTDDQVATLTSGFDAVQAEGAGLVATLNPPAQPNPTPAP